jgi:hypothetical protein
VAAGLAMLRHLKTHPEVYQDLERRAARLCASAPAGITVNRVGSMFTFFFTDQPVTDYETAKRSDTARFGRFFLHMGAHRLQLLGFELFMNAAVFFLVNATYVCLIWELIRAHEVSPAVRGIMRFRSVTTLCLFGIAAIVALKYPLAGLGICICWLIVYLKRDPPGLAK